MPVSSDPDEIHVGIVTALPVECAAVRLLVDDLVDQPAPGDPNHYMSGWLPSRELGRPHRVVVAMQAQDGTRNAATISTDLIRSFPHVRCVVMCGIAGGMPTPAVPERHGRVGDIVVGTGGGVGHHHHPPVNRTHQARRPGRRAFPRACWGRPGTPAPTGTAGV